jgi:7-cyano-7-deazaguanine synthase in queuosine biosynthesis
MKPSTMINFSGGLDATYCLIKELKKSPPGSVLVHHCNYSNIGSTIYNQLYTKATNKILNQLSEHYDFKLINSIFDKIKSQSLEIIPKSHAVENIAFITSQIINEHPSINKLIISASYYDLNQGTGYIKRATKRLNILKAYLNNANIELVYPIAIKSRDEMYKELPEEYQKLVVSCLYPQEIRSGIYSGCNKCISCISSSEEYNNRELML